MPKTIENNLTVLEKELSKILSKYGRHTIMSDKDVKKRNLLLDHQLKLSKELNKLVVNDGRKLGIPDNILSKILDNIGVDKLDTEAKVREALEKASKSGSSDNSLKDKAKNKFKDVKPKLLNKILNLIDDGTIKTGKDLDNIEINKKSKKKQPEPESESDEEEVPVKKVGRPRKNP